MQADPPATVGGQIAWILHCGTSRAKLSSAGLKIRSDEQTTASHATLSLSIVAISDAQAIIAVDYASGPKAMVGHVCKLVHAKDGWLVVVEIYGRYAI